MITMSKVYELQERKKTLQSRIRCLRTLPPNIPNWKMKARQRTLQQLITCLQETCVALTQAKIDRNA